VVRMTADTPMTGQAPSTDSFRCSTSCKRGCSDFVPNLFRRAVRRSPALSLARVLALALVLIAPVAGPVEREFDPGRPFEAGRHRGVDLAAAPGTPVRAACGGFVAFAGRIGASGIVTLRCGPWRVTHMPLATLTVRAGASISSGARIGTVAASSDHAGLHLGVRRDGTRFGYVDPLRFLARPTTPVPLGRAPRAGRPSRPPTIVRPPRAAPGVVREPRAIPRFAQPPLGAPPIVWSPPRSLPLAPWPAWAGLALVLAGAGVRLRARRRTYSNPVVTAAER
jgi:Peptidase family M23